MPLLNSMFRQPLSTKVERLQNELFKAHLDLEQALKANSKLDSKLKTIVVVELEDIGQIVIDQDEVGGPLLQYHLNEGNFNIMRNFYKGKLMLLHEMAIERNEELDVVATNAAQNVIDP
ncbi:hypothetical protein V8G54_033679 [Vigna mungo]|uniref:Uncharacterized protein n=1 Tax=Vigna mungo TaxID=3915 RepID=A0AAQ3MNQ9_VIGMU